MMNLLSPQEQHLFNCLKDYLDTHHYSPTISELQVAIGERSRSEVQELLGSLKLKGYITWNPKKRRTNQVLQRGVPVLGMIQAGFVVEHPADLVEWAEIPGVPCRSGLYALRVCERYGKWETVSGRFYPWRKKGLWHPILVTLQQKADRKGQLN
jgi:repressor LexA